MPLQVCTISGTLYNPNGQPVKAHTELSIQKAVKSGTVLMLSPVPVYTLDDTGAISFTVPRGCTVYLQAVAYVGNTSLNRNGGVRLTVPNSATATLESLGATATGPSTGLTIQDDGTPLPNLYSTLNIIGADISEVDGVATVDFSESSGGTWGSITGTLASQTDLQAALNAKQAAFASQNANLIYAGPSSGSAASPSFRSLVAADIPTHNQAWGGVTGTPTTLSGYGITDAQGLNTNLTTIAGLSPSNDDILQRKAGAWANRTLAQVKSDLALDNVTNVAQLPLSYLDTDSTLAANSATRVPAQSAVKSYVDNISTGLSWKTACLVRTTGGVTLSGEQTIDGQLTSGSRVLVMAQSDSTQNGIYTSASGSWTRTSDADSGAELVNATVFVSRGTLYGDTQWTCTNDSVTIGVTSIAFAQVSGAGTYSAGFALTLTGNQFAVTDSELVALAGLTSAADRLPYFTGSGSASLATFTSFGRSLVDDSDASTARSTLGLVIGSDVQAFNSNLSTYAGIAPSANVQTLLGAADYATVRTSLGLVIGTNVQAWDADLDTWATKTPYAGSLVITTGKTVTISNTLTFTGTDGSTLNVGTGGTFQSVSALTDTWNNSGTTFSAVKMTVTDTASAVASLLMQLQVSSSDKFVVQKNGFIGVNINPPSSALHIGSSTLANILRIDSVTAGGQLSYIDFHFNGTLKSILGLANSADQLITGSASGDLCLRSGAGIAISGDGGTTKTAYFAGTTLTLGDAVNFALNATTGTKIGTATSQKLGLWNATPIIQPASANQAAITDSTGGTPGFTLTDVGVVFSQAAINSNFASLARLVDNMRTAMVNSGLMKGAA